MQQSTKPKISLFKQKIKKARQNQKKQISSFPKPIKIDLISQKKSSIIDQNNNHNNFVENLLHNSLSKKQLDQIHQQNQKRIQQMSKQEIQSYQKMIHSQLPKGFYKKIAKNKVKQSNQINKQNELQQNIKNQNTKIQQQNISSSLGSIESLAIDIKTWQLIFLVPHLNSSQIIGCENLKLMLGSENNQTKIIGCKVLTNLCKGIMKKVQNKQIHIFKVNGIPFHLNMVIQDICYSLFRSLMMSMKKTSFRSCWIQMLASLTQCATLFLQNLNSNFGFLKQLYEFLLNQKQKKGLNKKQYPQINEFRKQKEMQEQKTAYFLTEKSIIIMIQRLEEKFQQSRNQHQQQIMNIFEKKNKNICLILQVILLQQTQNHYNFIKVLDKLKKQIQQYDYKQGIRICYCLCKQLRKINNNNIINIVINKMYMIWGKYIKYSIQKQKIFKCQPINIYQILFCYQFLNRPQFINFIEQCKKNHLITDDIVNILTFLTIDQYHKRPCSIQQINNIQQMLQYTSFNLSSYDPIYTFINLLSIFQQDQNSYSSINEAILNQTFSNLCQNIQHLEQLWEFLTIQRVKQLIRKYNYNSFGNYCFTRVMLYLLVTCNNNGLQSLMIQQLAQRYPFLFYYATQNIQVYGKQKLYEYKNQNQQQKQITYKMLLTNENLKQENLFVVFMKKNN